VLFSIEGSERAMSILEALIPTSGSVMWHENLDGLLVLLERLASDLRLQMVLYYSLFVITHVLNEHLSCTVS